MEEILEKLFIQYFSPEAITNYLTTLLIRTIISLIILIFMVIKIIGQWNFFKKAGKPEWASIIPFYNIYTLFEIADVPPLLFVISVIFIVIYWITKMIYHLYKLLPIIEPFFIFMLVITGILAIISLVIRTITYIKIAKKFDKSVLFGLGLTFLPFIFCLILGFDNSKYHETEKS